MPLPLDLAELARCLYLNRPFWTVAALPRRPLLIAETVGAV